MSYYQEHYERFSLADHKIPLINEDVLDDDKLPKDSEGVEDEGKAPQV